MTTAPGTSRAGNEDLHRFRSGLGCVLQGIGFTALILAFIAILGFVSALMARIQHGRGLLFADVEIFGALGLVFLVLGGVAMFAGVRLRRTR